MNACFSKFWRPPRQDTGSFEDWWKFGNWQKISKFLKLGVGLVTCWQISHSNKQKIALVWLGPKKKKRNQLHFNGKTSTRFPPYHRKACLSRIQWKPSVRKSKSLLYPQDFLKKKRRVGKHALSFKGYPFHIEQKVHFLGNQKCSLYIVHSKNDAPSPLDT